MDSRVEIRTLDCSFSLIKGESSKLQRIHDLMKVEKPDAWFDPLVKRGFKSPYVYFTKLVPEGLVVMNGHLPQLKTALHVNPENTSEDKNYFSEDSIIEYLKNIKHVLPFDPYDFQIQAFKESLMRGRGLVKMCTGSGKSLTISLLLDFFMKHGLRGLLMVPNINLLTQFKNDIKSYCLDDLYNSCETLGGSSEGTTFDKPVLISTWQSMNNHMDKLNFDYIVCDECHRYSSDVTSNIIQQSKRTGIRLGFTGTLPDDPTCSMLLRGLFAAPRTYITAGQLIDRGLGTPISIHTLILDYPTDTKMALRRAKYATQLKMIKECTQRNNIISTVATRLYNKKQSTLVLYSHTEHGKTLFKEIVKKLHPEVEIKPKDITGKNSLCVQQKLGVYFINGEDDASTREATRVALERSNGEQGAILVSNYSILSTGVNIKSLQNLIMASPLKSYTTITQSIGRGIRKHPNKKVFNVFDLVDNLGLKKTSGVFFKQYEHRCSMSYAPEGYRIDARVIKLKES